MGRDQSPQSPNVVMSKNHYLPTKGANLQDCGWLFVNLAHQVSYNLFHLGMVMRESGLLKGFWPT